MTEQKSVNTEPVADKLKRGRRPGGGEKRFYRKLESAWCNLCQKN